MKKVFLAGVAVLTIALGGCASTTLQSDVATVEADVQADANVLCGFIPTAATIAAFIPEFGAVAASAATIAEGICSAVAQAPVVAQPASVRLKTAGSADVPVVSVKTPTDPVTVVGHFTR